MWMGAVRRRSECARNRRAVRASGARVVVVDCLYWNSTLFCFWLARAEGNDAPDGIVRRHADGHAISRNNFYAEAAHSAAELSQHFVACVALDAIKAARMHGDYGSLHVYQVVFAQQLILSPN